MALLHLSIDDDYIQKFVDSLDREKVKIVEKDFELNKEKFEKIVQDYKTSSDEFLPYYDGVGVIVKSSLYDTQLKEILNMISDIDKDASKHFESYLKTIILNMQTKLSKYKNSVYFNNDDIKDIEFQGCTIPFLLDDKNNKIILLGISAKN